MRYGADALDSLTSDWTISDDGNDYGPVTTWPAPNFGLDDRSTPGRAGRPHRTEQRSAAALFDAYAFLRRDPDAAMLYEASDLAVDRHGFLRRGPADREAGDLPAPRWLLQCGAVPCDDAGAVGAPRPKNFMSLSPEERRRLAQENDASKQSGFDRAVASVGSTLWSVTKTVAPFAQTALSFVPGVGAVVNGAVAAGVALAQGKPITDAIIDGAASALPGGPLAKQAFNTARGLVQGQSITTAALNAARDQLPGGQVAKAAFDTAVALAQGQSLQKAAIGAATKALPSIVPNLPGNLGQHLVTAASSVAQGQNVAKAALGAAKDTAMASLSPYAQRALSTVGPKIGSITTALPSLVPNDAKQVADALLRNPSLRSLPISELARRMNLPESVARAGSASLLQSIARSGGAAIPHLAPARELESRIPTSMTFDRAMSEFASRAAPKAFSPNAQRVMTMTKRAAPVFSQLHSLLGARGFGDAGALDPTTLPILKQGSSGPFVTQWQTILRIGIDGQFGPQTAAATKAFQAKNGLGADGIVGPKTWAAGLASLTPTAVPATPAPPPVATPIPLPPLPPIVTTIATASTPVVASAMPVLRQGASGVPVATWQKIVGVPADGKFGPQTTAATIAWQSRNGLASDGVVGPASWQKAMSGALPTTPASVPSSPPVATAQPLLREGSSGPAVATWQKIVGVPADGKFGPQTTAATKALQARSGIAVDGIVGPQTWAAGLAGARTPPALPPTSSLPPITLPPMLPPTSFPGLPPIITRTIDEIPTRTPIIPIPPYVPGSTSTTNTPDGPVTQTTDRTGGVITVTQPPILGVGGIGALVALGLLGLAVAGGKKLL